jgi:hypothetical protein
MTEFMEDGSVKLNGSHSFQFEMKDEVPTAALDPISLPEKTIKFML